MSKRRENRYAAERWDVLEDTLPRQSCQVTRCTNQADYEWAGAFGTRWLCGRHRPLYRAHDRILGKIRSL